MPARTPDALAWLVDQGDRRLLPRVRAAHLGLADRLLAPVPALRHLHESAAGAAYAAGSLGLRGSAAGLRLMGRHGVGPRLDGRASGLLAAVDALDPAAPLGPTMAVRADGRDVPLAPDALAAAYPRAGGHVVVLVHGLLEHDGTWSAASGPSYPGVLAARTAATPVVVRYATGRAPGETGGELARLLTSLVDAWPVGVTRLTLVGHGLGGRVVQSAARHGLASAADWPALVREVVLLGEPESGAPGEKLARLAAPLRPAPVRALGAGRARLLVGTLTPTTWEGREVTAAWGDDRRSVAPLPRTTVHVARRPGRPLLPDPRVADLLVGWLGERPAPMLGPTPTEGEPDGRA
ncbi:esterase/lipase family protein [Aeromicrobium massiliense]|uniref:esterase/lipase family protein n=1 Tax=Aeromicrobium massiliense TaxID=1464554 RepID=UPI0006769E9C|nr:alpha/beta hydrolase [Aeromicrobium massiliense]